MYGENTNKYLKVIKMVCKDRLEQEYPAGVPDEISERYKWELEAAKNSDSVDELYVYYILSDEAKRAGMPLFVRGNTRCSLLVYLLGDSMINPCDAHYYCEKCGHYEHIKLHYYGMDAKNKNCPKCKKRMKKDGFSLDQCFEWGINPKNPKLMDIEYNIVNDFLPFARRRLVKEFPEHEITGSAMEEWTDGKSTGKMSVGGFVILPKGKTLDDFPEQIVYMDDGEKGFFGSHRVIDELRLFRIMLLDNPLNDMIYRMQMKTGIFHSEIRKDDISGYMWRDIVNTYMMFGDEEDIFNENCPKTFYDMAELISADHCTWKGSSDGESDESVMPMWKEMKESGLFEEHPIYSRNSLMHFLIENGADREDAFRFAEYVRKGRASHKGQEWEKFLKKVKLPQDVQLACEGYRYMWSQAHSLEYLIGYAMCAYYQKFDSRAYAEVSNSNNISV